MSEKIFSDDDPDDLERSILPEAIHRNVDLAIVKADQEGMHTLAACFVGLSNG